VPYGSEHGSRAVLILPVAGPHPGIGHQFFVWYVAVLNVVFGLILLVIDLHAGMPLVWTLFEGPSIIVFGVVVALLNRSVTGIP
jgi:hypothetical protein